MRTRPRPTPVRLLAGLAGLASAAALTLGLLALPADAHDGDAIVTVEAVHPAGTSIHYVVRVTWVNDGHPAVDATVTATAVGADGTQLTPVALPPVDSDGRYAGAVDYPAPGNWTVRITSIDPTGSAEQAQEVTPPPTTEATEGGSEVATGSADGGFAPADDDTGASGEQAAGGGSDDGGMPVYLVVAAAAVVLIGAVTAVNIIRRNRAHPPAGPPSGDTSTTH